MIKKQQVGIYDHLVLHMSAKDKGRFFSKIEKHKDCWIFRDRSGNGYGHFYLKGKILRAHRVSKVIETGVPEKHLYACHICLNKSCVNPSHISWQTPRENSADQKRDGTHKRLSNAGERHYSAKLSDKKVLEIWRRFHSGNEGSVSIAIEFGVAKSTVLRIANGETWTHVTNNLAKRAVPADGVTLKRGAEHYMTSLSDKDVKAIKKMIYDGMSNKCISEIFSVSASIISNIRIGRNFKHVRLIDANHM